MPAARFSPLTRYQIAAPFFACRIRRLRHDITRHGCSFRLLPLSPISTLFRLHWRRFAFSCRLAASRCRLSRAIRAAFISAD